VLGDTPYSEGEAVRLDRMIDAINLQPLRFVVHVGDIGTTAQGCTDAWILKRKAQFERIRHPFILLPGDNEWSDCHFVGRDPMERLSKWRSLFCSRQGNLKLERQAGEYCEHIRWRAGNTLFVALNVPGNNNNVRHPEHARRMGAVYEWLDEAEKLQPQKLVVLMQANPFVPRLGYSDLIDWLRRLGERMPGRVVLVHGDTHVYRDDEPLPGLRRVEVWGAPFVSWARFTVVEGELQAEGAGQY
jgi:hypothetical protein